MGVRVINLCLHVRQATVGVTVEGNEFCKNPEAGPYYFRVWAEAGGQGASSSGDSVSLTQEGTYRVAAWTVEDPGTVPSGIFDEPTSIDDRVQIQLSGGTCTVNSGGGEDPWPPPAK